MENLNYENRDNIDWSNVPIKKKYSSLKKVKLAELSEELITQTTKELIDNNLRKIDVELFGEKYEVEKTEASVTFIDNDIIDNTKTVSVYTYVHILD